MKKLIVLALLVCLVIPGLFAQQVAPSTPVAPQQQEIRREFTTAGDHFFVFSERFPATVEIYILGAGGGGQGGHSKAYQQGLGTRTERGAGAGGGGGAAIYTRISINSPTTFNISIGAGGIAGAGINRGVGGSWESARPGTAGGNTTVSFGSTTITANGGAGGGGTGAQNVTGGAGGVPGTAPQGILAWASRDGERGSNGVHNSDNGGAGGDSGYILQNTGSITSLFYGRAGNRTRAAANGAGGAGGHGNVSGFAGGDGHVVVIVRY